MKILRLAIKNIRWHRFRSVTIFLAVVGVTGMLLSTALIIQGSEYSLNSGLQRMGADILVVPAGAETKLESALLMGKPTDVWMPLAKVDTVLAVPGVAQASPQVYLTSLYGAACCAVWEMFIVVYDPVTDFTVNPWLRENIGRDLKTGEVIGGHYISVPPDWDNIALYGYGMELVGNLSATGTGLDQTLFMTLETAREMARVSKIKAEQELIFDPTLISSIMVKVTDGADAHKVALDILYETTGLVPIESPDLFGNFRAQMKGLLWGFFTISIIIWILSIFLIGLIFSMAANERRREMAVLRALGATKRFIFGAIISEVIVMGFVGSVTGIVVVAGGFYLVKDFLAGSLRMPFLFPSIPSFIGLVSAGVALAIISVSVSAMIPAFRLSRQELAIVMRE